MNPRTFRKFAKPLTEIISCNEKKSPGLEGMKFLIHDYPLIEVKEDKVDELGHDIKIFIHDKFRSPKHKLANDHFR